MRQFLLSGILAAAFVAPAFAAGQAKLSVDVSVRDLSSRFVDFYDTARKPAPVVPTPPAAPTADGKPAVPAAPAVPAESETDRRWRLFKSRYNFTTQADDASARAALDAAWPRYADKIDDIVGGFDTVKDEWSRVSNAVLTGVYVGGDKVPALRLVTYVGTFDGKVWSAQDGDRLNIYVPLEVSPDERDLRLARVMTRDALPLAAVWHAQPRNLTEFIIGEGVVAHVLAKAVPGKSVEAYLDLTPEQLAEVKANRKAFFSEILGQLKDSSPAVMSAYAGPKLAQARYAGWLLAEDMLKEASTNDLIRQKQSDLVGVSMKTLVKINRAK